jgi:hypothetical protein
MSVVSRKAGTVHVLDRLVRPGAPVPADQDDVDEGVEHGQFQSDDIGVAWRQFAPILGVGSGDTTSLAVTVVVSKHLGPHLGQGPRDADTRTGSPRGDQGGEVGAVRRTRGGGVRWLCFQPEQRAPDADRRA